MKKAKVGVIEMRVQKAAEIEMNQGGIPEKWSPGSNPDRGRPITAASGRIGKDRKE